MNTGSMFIASGAFLIASEKIVDIWNAKTKLKLKLKVDKTIKKIDNIKKKVMKSYIKFKELGDIVSVTYLKNPFEVFLR